MSGPISLKPTLSAQALADAIARISPDQGLPASLIAQISPRAQSGINDNRDEWAKFGDLKYVKRTVAQALGGYRQSMQIELEQTELDTIMSGGRKLTSLRSIYRRLFRLSIELYPLNGPAPKARQPAKMFKRGLKKRLKKQPEQISATAAE